MTCRRCASLMVETRLMDEEAVLWAWRCPICGDCRDPVIEYHRSLPSQPEPTPNSLPVFRGGRWTDYWVLRLKRLGKVC